MYIDLSKYNRVVDWNEVSKHVEGVILRVGYRGYGSGKIVIDPMFEMYAKKCYDYDIPIGLYFMSQAINVMEAIEEAEFSMGYAEKYHAKLPIYIDSEDGDGTSKVVRADGLSRDERTKVCESFCKSITNFRGRAGIYASTSWFQEKLDVYRLDDYLLWVAQYGPQCTARHRIDMWQYTDKGSVPGIIGNVDCSILYNNSSMMSNLVLKRGSVGPEVSKLQYKLNTSHNYNLTVDGVFGIATENAVKDLQRKYNLKVDGIVGSETKSVL